VLAEKLGTYSPFWVYSGICLLGFLFIKTKVKETKGKTLEELEYILVSH
jgi:SP family xylose:H+ symportor-like MFS transporter